jgi:DNA-binding FadR family transcriptional regulator
MIAIAWGSSGLGLPRVRSAGLAATAFRALSERIVAGDIPPGTTLSERQLCDELGVSRTAVREAIARLEQQRLVAVRQGGQTRVLDFRETAGLDVLRCLTPEGRAPSAEIVRGGLEMRAAIAPDVARLAALRRGDDVPPALDAIVARMRASASDRAALQDQSLRFWAILVAASDNLAYRLAFNSLREALEPLRRAAGDALAAEFADLRGYAIIARAVRAKDAGAAARAARAHVAIGLGALGLAAPSAPGRRRR